MKILISLSKMVSTLPNTYRRIKCDAKKDMVIPTAKNGSTIEVGNLFYIGYPSGLSKTLYIFEAYSDYNFDMYPINTQAELDMYLRGSDILNLGVEMPQMLFDRDMKLPDALLKKFRMVQPKQKTKFKDLRTPADARKQAAQLAKKVDAKQAARKAVEDKIFQRKLDTMLAGLNL